MTKEHYSKERETIELQIGIRGHTHLIRYQRGSEAVALKTIEEMSRGENPVFTPREARYLIFEMGKRFDD